eukprot:scaffold308630_cov33-Tisochrysis_lutea.AAC.1
MPPVLSPTERPDSRHLLIMRLDASRAPNNSIISRTRGTLKRIDATPATGRNNCNSGTRRCRPIPQRMCPTAIAPCGLKLTTHGAISPLCSRATSSRGIIMRLSTPHICITRLQKL